MPEQNNIGVLNGTSREIKTAVARRSLNNFRHAVLDQDVRKASVRDRYVLNRDRDRHIDY